MVFWGHTVKFLAKKWCDGVVLAAGFLLRGAVVVFLAAGFVLRVAFVVVLAAGFVIQRAAVAGHTTDSHAPECLEQSVALQIRQTDDGQSIYLYSALFFAMIFPAISMPMMREKPMMAVMMAPA